MKIAFLLQSTTALTGLGNGIRVQAERQAEALRGLGHEVVQLSPWDSVTDQRFDVVQFFVGGPGFHGIEAKRRVGGKKLVFAPIIDSNEPNWRYRLATAAGSVWPNRFFTVPGLFRKQALASDLVICRSRHEQERVVKGLGIPIERTAIVLNGVDPPVGADGERIRQKLDLPKEFVLHVSSYGQGRKNVVRMIEAVAPLGIPLVIAGTAEPGPTLDRIRELAAKYPQVRLLGYLSREDLTDLYAACKVFCLPSIHEGTGLVALEAAVCGAAIVITKHGGPPDYFADLATYVEPISTIGIRDAVRTAFSATRDARLQCHVNGSLTWNSSAQSLIVAYERARP